MVKFSLIYVSSHSQKSVKPFWGSSSAIICLSLVPFPQHLLTNFSCFLSKKMYFLLEFLCRTSCSTYIALVLSFLSLQQLSITFDLSALISVISDLSSNSFLKLFTFLRSLIWVSGAYVLFISDGCCSKFNVYYFVLMFITSYYLSS